MQDVLAAHLIANERLQLIFNGLTPDREDQLDKEELSEAARGYRDAEGPTEGQPWNWPFSDAEWQPAHRLTNLARAGALYQAEVDRLIRLLAAAHAGLQVCVEELDEAIAEERKDCATCSNCGGEIPASEARAGFTECEHCAS